ncbi:DUF1211 domain-containing protein (plasmid) [Deinococcus sp. KNUC1210]|uniref:TMEM175 family protein n=1 Tax=Deinococcus sp. KNUC1210 TaxID=2917691 RepID=UPI001EF154C8|nr:TMEM175 family protein [Deinococcus sp. KNUC1210]ULH17082.1 DUF1211 domain-containing protein [Deinococcus sp. KNUC1210]
MPALNAFFKSSGRLEAFSDGVFAIAITLLILEIRVPSVEDASTPPLLWHALISRWPSYFAFLLSFGTIFVAWIGHHLMLQQVKVVTLSLVWTNALFLLFVTFLPFPTALVAEHLTHPSGSVAVALYAASNAMNSFLYLRLSQVTRLAAQGADADPVIRFAALNAWGGMVVCLGCIGLAFVTPIGALLLVAAVWIWWSLPQRAAQE